MIRSSAGVFVCVQTRWTFRWRSAWEKVRWRERDLLCLYEIFAKGFMLNWATLLYSATPSESPTNGKFKRRFKCKIRRTRRKNGWVDAHIMHNRAIWCDGWPHSISALTGRSRCAKPMFLHSYLSTYSHRFVVSVWFYFAIVCCFPVNFCTRLVLYRFTSICTSFSFFPIAHQTRRYCDRGWRSFACSSEQKESSILTPQCTQMAPTSKQISGVGYARFVERLDAFF